MKFCPAFISNLFGTVCQSEATAVSKSERRFVSLRSVQIANATMMGLVAPRRDPLVEEILRKHPITPEKIQEAGRVTMASMRSRSNKPE